MSASSNASVSGTPRQSPRIGSGFWARAKTQSKAGFDKLWATADKLGDPVNRFSNRIGSEAFWPTTIDKESEKAARILKSFCKDGFYEEQVVKSTTGPQQKQRVLKRIPAKVIQNAKGLAVFTTMRTGLWVSGAGGSGILIARKEDGSWSPPVGIMLHTAGLGFLVGVDIYDCVLVLNTPEAVAAFSRWRCTVGGEISAVAGPAGVGGMLETEVHKRQAPVFTYLKSRGFYAGVQIDGTVIIERTDENERFYGEKLPAKDILAGRAQSREYELTMLMATLKSAEGDTSVDRSLLPAGPPPADMQVVAGGQIFGVPDKEDPDPYGVHALEKEGFVIKEAGSHTPANSEQFDFNPSITSPVYDTFRRSIETGSRRTSWRGSILSTSTAAEKERERVRYVTSDSATQTDFPPVNFPSPRSAGSRRSDREMDELSPTRSVKSSLARGLGIEDAVPEDQPLEISRKGSTVSATSAAGSASSSRDKNIKLETEREEKLVSSGVNGEKSFGSDEDDGDDETDHEIHEVPVIQQVVQQAARPQVMTRPKVVAVPARGPPPKLPPRHPGRSRSFGANGTPDGSTPPSDNEATETASIASITSATAASIRSVRSGRAGSVHEEKPTIVGTTMPSLVQIPAEEESAPILENDNTTAGQTEGRFTSTSQVATPVATRFNSRDLEPPAPATFASGLTTPSPPTTTETAAAMPKISPSPTARAATLESVPNSSNTTAPRPRPNMSATVRQNSASSVSALKSRFETKDKPAAINTTTSSTTSRSESAHSANRSNSPLKQLASYTTSADERKAGRISPVSVVKRVETEPLPGAFPNDLDGAADSKPGTPAVEEKPITTAAQKETKVNGVLDAPVSLPPSEPKSLRTGRSPLKHLPAQEVGDVNGVATTEGSQEEKAGRDVSPPTPLSPRKGPSLLGLRNSLHVKGDDESDGSRSRSISPMKSPMKLGNGEEDFS